MNTGCGHCFGRLPVQERPGTVARFASVQWQRDGPADATARAGDEQGFA
jgi:hypothetical protein